MRSRLLWMGTCLLLLVVQAMSQWIYEAPDSGREENEECNREGDRVWVCKKDTECPSSRVVIQNGGRLKTCSWKSARTHIVCCPPEPLELSISEQRCAEYQALLCLNTNYRGPSANTTSTGSTQRAKRQTSIPRPFMGGQNASPQEDPDLTQDSPEQADEDEGGTVFAVAAIGGEMAEARENPHMALIGYGDARAINWQCGGSLISKRFVLSAAHCSDTSYGPARWARLGDLDISSDSDDALPQQFEIIERLVHSGYRAPAYYNDIVIFRLDRDVVFDRYVGPACLHNSLADPVGTGIATGWGRNETNGPRSSFLVKVNLKFIPTEQCKRNVGILPQVLPTGFDSRTMMCAGEPGKDTCQGDSGGPLILGDKGGLCLARQVGVTSFGPKNCGMAQVTGAYVRVAYFLPWIESVVWPK